MEHVIKFSVKVDKGKRHGNERQEIRDKVPQKKKTFMEHVIKFNVEVDKGKRHGNERQKIRDKVPPQTALTQRHEPKPLGQPHLRESVCV